MAYGFLFSLPDISIDITIPVFYWDGFLVVMGFLAVMALYWMIKLVITTVTGG